MSFFLPMIISKVIEHATKPAPAAEPAPTPYKKPTVNIPHLFIESEQKYSTAQWADHLASSPSDYQHCQIVSLTWGKALTSDLSHEFVQFIVEDTRTGSRTRCFTERLRKDDPDRVIVGRDYSTAYNPSGQMDLPMPLKSLIFHGEQRPSVVHFARLLAAITARAPTYNIITMCWWYAQTVFETAKMVFGGELKEWPFASFAYTMVVWQIHFLDRAEMEEQARRFKKQNIEGLSYSVSPDAKKQVTLEAHLKKVAGMLEDEKTVKQYEEAMRVDGTEKVDPQLLKDAVHQLESKVSKPSISNYDLEKASDVFTETILKESDKNENLEAYEAAWQKNMCVEKNRPEDDTTRFLLQRPFYTGPGHEKKEAFEVAMRCFVGGVLRSMNEGANTTVTKEAEMP